MRTRFPASLVALALALTAPVACASPVDPVAQLVEDAVAKMPNFCYDHLIVVGTNCPPASMPLFVIGPIGVGINPEEYIDIRPVWEDEHEIEPLP